jgi:hypothetical protein
MTRQQLPPEIRKIEVLDRTTGKKVTRYEVRVEGSTCDVVVENDHGTVSVRKRRVQTKRRYDTEKAARARQDPKRCRQRHLRQPVRSDGRAGVRRLAGRQPRACVCTSREVLDPN